MYARRPFVDSKTMNATPQIRFAEFADPWEQRKLGELAEKVTAKNLTGAVKEVFTNSAEFGVISQSDFFDHEVAKQSSISGYYVVEPGDFVYNPRISTTAPVGPIRRNMLGRRGVMSPLYTVFRLTTDVDGTYLSHYFKTDGWHPFMRLEGNSGARSDRFSIGDSTFFEMPIPLPSEAEQAEIGRFLDSLDALITLHQREHDKLFDAKQSMLQKMFPNSGARVPEIRLAGFADPWEKCELGDVIREFYAGQTPYRENQAFWGGDVNWLASGDLNKGIVTSTAEKITPEGRVASGLKLVPAGTVVVATMGQEAAGTRGNCCILGISTTINQACMALYPDESRLDRQFLFQWYKAVGNEYGMKYTQGTKQQNYNEDLLSKLEIRFPSLPEQRAIGQLFSHLDALISLQQRELEKLKSLKQSLLQGMFV